MNRIERTRGFIRECQLNTENDKKKRSYALFAVKINKSVNKWKWFDVCCVVSNTERVCMCMCVNSFHFFCLLILGTEYGFSERREPKWFYLFIYSVYTSVVFFYFFFTFFYFHSIVNAFASLLLSYWRNNTQKKPQCDDDDERTLIETKICIHNHSAYICYFGRCFNFCHTLIVNAKALCCLFWSMFDVLSDVYVLRINNGEPMEF